MKKTPPKFKEEQMYEAVKMFFEKEMDCRHIYADLRGEKTKIHLLKDLCKRDPDVVGVTEDGEVYVAEGKSLARGGHSFTDCVNQVISLKAFADHLYVFFPLAEWERLKPE